MRGHHAPVARTPAIILWGPDASSDVPRNRTRCSKCVLLDGLFDLRLVARILVSTAAR